MNKVGKSQVQLNLADVFSNVRADMNRMGMLSKHAKKTLHKQRMQNFQNNAFNNKDNGKGNNKGKD